MKERITKTSIALFGEKGYSETSVQDIVDALGVTKGTFYYYFGSKQQLLMDIHVGFIDHILAREKQILSDNAIDGKTKILEIVRMLIRNIGDQGLAARIFFREMRNLDQDQVARVTDKQDKFRLALQRLIEKGVANGQFRGDL
ncbi:MAG TPA: TetR/AcrR family transcriptional regulator, partial [Bacillales bacterium]|nr:TetR/AcrR family transcriptional regulator [Bacillales bacterium]